jgi:hypothetical protein
MDYRRLAIPRAMELVGVVSPISLVGVGTMTGIKPRIETLTRILSKVVYSTHC